MSTSCRRTTVHDAPTEALRVGVEVRRCGGCHRAYLASEQACPTCGPRAARSRWMKALLEEAAELPVEGVVVPGEVLA